MKKLLFLSLAFAFALSACSFPQQGEKVQNLSLEEAKVMATDFINNNLMQAGQEVSIKEVVEEGNLYKVVVNAPGSEDDIVSYLTKDGKTFFPQGLDVAEYIEKSAEAKNQQAAASQQEAAKVEPAEVSNVELFIMSYCPYGTQIEKGILPVLEALGDKVDFELKFCDYAMHGEKELNEQLNQYCIQKEQNAKLLPYLKCFLADSDSDACLKETGVNVGKLKTCVKNTDNEFDVTKNFADKSTWKGNFPTFNVHKEETDKYGVAGSPSIVINGAKVSSGRDANSLLKLICSGYENPPEECNTELDSTSPAPGFGFGGTGSATNAGCGS